MALAQLVEQARRAAGLPQHIAPPPYRSIGHLLEVAAARHPQRPAFTSLGRTLSYAELERLSGHFAAWLQREAGLLPGERIALQLPNLVQYPVAFFGAIRAGLVVVNTNPLYTPRELEHQLCDSGASALVVLANVAAKAQEVLHRTPVRQVIVTEVGDLQPAPRRLLLNAAARYLRRAVPPFRIPGSIGLHTALRRGAREPHAAVSTGHDDLAALQYTGGTTGVSKGAMLTHGNILHNVAQAITITEGFPFREGEEALMLPLPLYHIYAFNTAMGMMAKGCHTVLVPDPRDVRSLVDAFARWRCSGFAGLNTLFVSLCEDARFRALDFSALRLVMSGGMALTLGAARRWQDVTGVAIVEGYGMTEASPVVSFNPVNANEPGTIGIPAPSTEVRILALDGHDLGPGEAGELLVRGPQVMRGYWQRPEETAQVLSADGWLRTGDIALMNDNGYLKIVDRKKDMIVVSGFNVYPNEIEDVLSQHPGVLECAAVGQPDERAGEAVTVFVVARDPGLTEDSLRAFCRERLTGYKLPRRYVFRDSLPKSSVGKILRRELRDS